MCVRISGDGLVDMHASTNLNLKSLKRKKAQSDDNTQKTLRPFPLGTRGKRKMGRQAVTRIGADDIALLDTPLGGASVIQHPHLAGTVNITGGGALRTGVGRHTLPGPQVLPYCTSIQQSSMAPKRKPRLRTGLTNEPWLAVDLELGPGVSQFKIVCIKDS